MTVGEGRNEDRELCLAAHRTNENPNPGPTLVNVRRFRGNRVDIDSPSLFTRLSIPPDVLWSGLTLHRLFPQ